MFTGSSVPESEIDGFPVPTEFYPRESREDNEGPVIFYRLFVGIGYNAMSLKNAMVHIR